MNQLPDFDLSKVVQSVVENIVYDINLNTAKALIEQVEKQAAQMGISVVIAVANSGARPVAVHCMDQSYIASYDIALNKAYTAVALKMSTKELKALSLPGQPLYGITHTNQGQIVILGGGMPLLYNGRIVGGLGVSGGSEQEDILLSEYGQNKFKEVMWWK